MQLKYTECANENQTVSVFGNGLIFWHIFPRTMNHWANALHFL